MAALIGALRVSLSADTATFQAGMKKAERQAKASSSAITKSLGAIKSGLLGFASGLSLGLLTQGIKNALDFAGSLGEVAQQLGVTTRELQVFRYVAGQNGVTLEEADKALGKFSLSISKARSGSKSAAEAFAAAGVTLKDLETKSKLELFGQVADKFKANGGASANAAAGVALFSKNFQKLVPTLDLGSKGFNELTAAAEQLGIVLDDQLINQADEAADKVDALQTILKAQISAAVAQNSNAIIELANSLVYLVSKIADAIRWWKDFKNALDAQAFDFASKNPFLSPEKRAEGARRAAVSRGKISDSGQAWGVGGSSVTVTLQPAKNKTSSVPTGAPTSFLGGGGGGRGRKDNSAEEAERKRLEALRDAFQFEEEQRRADMDILRAKQQLATDYVARTALSIEMLNLEKIGFEAGLQYQIAAKELTEPQAQILRLKQEEVDQLSRDAVLQEEESDRLKDYNHLADLDFDLARDRLESEAQLAETASERRDVELRLLDLAYRQERARLAAIILEEESKDIAQQNFARLEEARRALVNLGKTEANDRAGVIQGTRGPLEDWQASLPTSAAKMQEAFEQLQVQGFEGLIDAAVALTDGFDSAKDALLDTLKQFLQGLLRAQLQSALGSILPSGGFKLPGFATGGSFTIGGRAGIDNNIMSINGLPVARISYGERINVSNDNGRNTYGSRGDMIVNVNGVRDFDSFRRNERQVGRAARRTLGIQQ